MVDVDVVQNDEGRSPDSHGGFSSALFVDFNVPDPTWIRSRILLVWVHWYLMFDP